MQINVFSAGHLRRHADHAGTAASALCAVHCLLTPLLAGFYPAFLRLLPGDALFHRTLAVAIVIAGAIAFIPGYRLHRRLWPAALALLGITFTLAVAWFGESMPSMLELFVSIPGSVMLVTAHIANRTFCRRCETCKDSPSCQSLQT